MKNLKSINKQNKISRLAFKICSDWGEHVLDATKCVAGVTVTCDLPFGSASLKMSEGGGTAEYFLSVTCEKDVTLYRIFAETQFKITPCESVRYDTFRDASAFSLFRFKDLSLLIGFANPIFTLEADTNTAKIGFAPSLKLRAGERYDCDRLFIVSCKRDGVYITPEPPVTANRVNGIYHTRYHNPSGNVSLDRREIRAFSKYLDGYLTPYCRELKVIFYTYFSPFPQLIKTDEQEQLYYEYIDNFKELGGDLIIFNPIQRIVLPSTADDGRWIIAPEGTRACRILEYCRKKGIGYGITWGSAVLNTNSPMTSYSLVGERNGWKKIGKGGEISRENCIASRDFYDWFYRAQVNTVKAESMMLWDWDPGPGNGSFCYSPDHGHIPGEGYYKGFRDSMRMIEEMKKECPELVVQSFHGLKEYGVWGMKGVDWHESYWEQDPYFFAAAYPDFSADRYTASGMRMQCCWNRSFRFLPAYSNQFMTARMIQNWGYPEFLRHLFDFYGYRYALMSALATGGSVTLPMFPDNIEIDGYREFYRKWIAWGRENYSYNDIVVPFGSQVRAGGVDGYAKWKGDRGFIFLCNPAPLDIDFSFGLDGETGFEGDGIYGIKQLYPMDNSAFYDVVSGKYSFKRGDKVHIRVPAYEIVLLEIGACSGDGLYNVSGEIKITGDRCDVAASSLSGTHADVAVRVPENVTSLCINGQDVPFKRRDGVICASVLFGESEPRCITGFTCGRERVYAPFNAQGGKKYTASVDIGENVKELLKKGFRLMSPEMRDAVKRAKTLGNDSYLWSQPDRLYLTVTFRDARDAGDVKLTLNGENCPLTLQTVPAHGLADDFIVGYYADVTDAVVFGDKNVFSITAERDAECFGIQLYYPSGEPSEKITRCKRTKAATAPREKEARPANETARRIVVNKGWIKEGYVEEYREFTLLADVNLPVDEIEGVYCTNPINIEDSKMTLMTDNRLSFDPSRGVWKKTFYMGTRQFLIVDEEFLSVWAVAKDGRQSERVRVKIEWKLF